MARKATNKLLQKAKKSKSDEFYTQLCDIESELKFYKTHFKDKVVFCNCDDPRTSNFPDQFELIKFRKGNDEKDLAINGKCPYFRILIKNKRIQIQSE